MAQEFVVKSQAVEYTSKHCDSLHAKYKAAISTKKEAFSRGSKWIKLESFWKVNQIMKAAGRKILLFIDNCVSHTLSLFFQYKNCLPSKNSTRRAQRMDQGIIKSLKENTDRCRK